MAGFCWMEGYHAKVNNPEEVGKELGKLEQKAGGKLKPSIVVNAAKAKRSPLHKHFTWDDAECGNKYRLWEARRLIRAVVHIPDKKDEPRRRVYVHVPSTNKKEREGTYEAVSRVVDNEELFQQAHAHLLQKLNSSKSACEELEHAARKTKNRKRVLLVAAINKALHEVTTMTDQISRAT